MRFLTGVKVNNSLLKEGACEEKSKQAHVDQTKYSSLTNKEGTMLTQKLKTHQRMPPQSAALKGRSADKTRVPSRNGTGRDAACQRGREERTGPVSPVPPPTRECGESVSSFKENACSPKHKREKALVFVLGHQGNSLMPCSPKRARKLLESKRALVACETPFTIRIKDREGGVTQPIHTLCSHADGYSYSLQKTNTLTPN